MTSATPIVPYLYSRLLQVAPVVQHGFATRSGGVSTGAYGSLNCGLGTGDDPLLVDENRRRVAAGFGIGVDALFTLRQVHGSGVIDAGRTRPLPDHEGDALVCREPGMMIGILTADCVPVLLADHESRVVGAAHAGWRGAVAGVIEATVVAMESLGARRGKIHAAIGPAIQKPSYEVGDDVRRAVAASVDFDVGFLFEGRGERYLFDLPGFARSLCLESGITLVDNIGVDTCADAAGFFSYRRSLHHAEPACGRQLSCIGIR